MIPAGWRQKGQPGHENFAPILLYSTWNTKEIGRVQPVLHRGQPHLPMSDRTVGNPAKLQDGVPVIMRVVDLELCREAGGG